MQEYIDRISNQAQKNIEEQKTVIDASLAGQKLVEEYNKTYKTFSKTSSKSRKLLDVGFADVN